MERFLLGFTTSLLGRVSEQKAPKTAAADTEDCVGVDEGVSAIESQCLIQLPNVEPNNRFSINDCHWSGH